MKTVDFIEQMSTFHGSRVAEEARLLCGDRTKIGLADQTNIVMKAFAALVAHSPKARPIRFRSKAPQFAIPEGIEV